MNDTSDRYFKNAADSSPAEDEPEKAFVFKPFAEGEAGGIEEKTEKLYDSIVPPVEREAKTDIVLKTEDGEGNIIGGCTAFINNWELLRVDVLWVDERYRKSGLGTLLISAAESAAREAGCYAATVGTGDFQARGFYEKHGYALCGTVKDSPMGHESYSLMKRLDTEAPESPDLRGFEIKPGSSEDAEYIDNKLGEYNAAHVTFHEPEDLGRKLEDSDGGLIGGISAATDGCGAAEIYALWVEDNSRGRGAGSALLLDVERLAREKGCNQLLVDTLDCFTPFFLKRGYSVCVCMEDVPRGHCWYSLSKRLK